MRKKDDIRIKLYIFIGNKLVGLYLDISRSRKVLNSLLQKIYLVLEPL